ncbi:MAG: M56 family metallopeptidase [Bacteroidia bacterium]|nr:M56 family metallopeptidase [Bacteroidia bacterium]
MHLFEIITSSALAQAFGWTLFHSLWQGFIWVLALSLILRYVSRQKAQLRYFASLLCLFGLFAGSFGTFLYEYRLISTSTFSLSLGADAHIIVNQPGQFTAAENSGFLQQISINVESWGRYLPYVSMIWMLGVLFFSVRWIGSWVYLQDIRRNSHEAKYKWQSWVDEIAHEMGIRKYVTLKESSQIQSPMVIGHLKPIILLPLGMLTNLSTTQLEAIFAHELAHIRRYDFLINMIQSFMEIIFFYHPAQWWISNQIRDEREHCCDDAAVEICGDPLAYAKALADLEEIRMVQLQLAPALSGRKPHLLNRIKRLMAPDMYESPKETRVYLMSLLILGLGFSFIINPGYAKNKVEKLMDGLVMELAEEPENEIPVLAPLALKTEKLEGQLARLETRMRIAPEPPMVAQIPRIQPLQANFELALATVNDTPPPPPPPMPPVPPSPVVPSMKGMPTPPSPPTPPVPMIGSFDMEDSVAMREFELQMEKFSKEMEVWGEKYGKLMEDYGQKMEVWSKSMEADWGKWEKEFEVEFKEWEKKYGKQWQKWGEDYGKEMEKWIKENEHKWEDLDREERSELREEMQRLHEEARRLHSEERREAHQEQREVMEEARVQLRELRQLAREKKVGEKAEIQREMEQLQRHLQEVQREQATQLREVEREARRAQREARVQIERAERDRERAHRTSKTLTEELVKDGIIEEGAKKLKVRITAKEMRVNGKKLSDAQFKKYVELLEGTGARMPKGNSTNSYILEKN